MSTALKNGHLNRSYLLLILCLALSVPSGLNGQDRYAGEVRDGRSYGEVIAVEHTGTVSPPVNLVLQFNELIDSISARCSESREWVADRILLGHQLLEERGAEASPLDVAVGWNEAVAGAGRSDCGRTLAVLLSILERPR